MSKPASSTKASSTKTTKAVKPSDNGKAHRNGKANGKVEVTPENSSLAKPTNGEVPNGHAALSNGKAQNGTTNQDWGKSTEWNILWLSVTDIAPNPFQPRIEFTQEEMDELIASVRVHGVQQPVLVRTNKVQSEQAADNGKTDKPHYHLVVGERRLRACKGAGKKRIPAILRDDLSDSEVAQLALVENLQRAKLNPIETARGYKRLMLEFRMKEEVIAKKVGLSPQSVKDAIRLLQLPESVLDLIAKKRLTPTHGQLLLRFAGFKPICEMIAQYAADNTLSAKSLEGNPLPNATVLEKKGWIASLDWRTKFEWKTVCGECPFGAYVATQYSSYCLKPAEWKAKNDAAIELQKQEAARVMEEARQNESQTVESESLPHVEYRMVAQDAPAGCTEACPCRRQMRDSSDPTQTIPICIDKSRYNELLQAERQKAEQERREYYEGLWHEAMRQIQDEIGENDWTKTVALFTRSLLVDARPYHVSPDSWWKVAQEMAGEMGIILDWDKLQDMNTGTVEELVLLSEVEPPKLLLLGVGLLLSQDAGAAARFHDNAPLLAFVVGDQGEDQIEFDGMGETNPVEDVPNHSEEVAPELLPSGDDHPDNEDYPDDEGNPYDEDEALAATHEAESLMLEEERERAALGS